MKRMILLLMAVGFVCTTQATIVTQDFDHGLGDVVTTIDSGGADDSETPLQMVNTGFSWGAMSADIHAQKGTKMESKSAVAGDYAYTIMDSAGGSIADTILDLTGPGAYMSISWKNTNDPGADLQLMVRNGVGNWYLSDTVYDYNYASAVYQIDVLNTATATWTLLGNTADMDEMDAGGEQVLTNLGPATPTLNAVDGFGYYYATSDPDKKKTFPNLIVLDEVPEPATMCLLGLGGLMLRRRKR